MPSSVANWLLNRIDLILYQQIYMLPGIRAFCRFYGDTFQKPSVDFLIWRHYQNITKYYGYLITTHEDVHCAKALPLFFAITVIELSEDECWQLGFWLLETKVHFPTDKLLSSDCWWSLRLNTIFLSDVLIETGDQSPGMVSS